jgi:hypothetical protein
MPEHAKQPEAAMVTVTRTSDKLGDDDESQRS